MNQVHFCQIMSTISVYIGIHMGFTLYSVNMVNEVTDFKMLNQSCIPEANSTWSSALYSSGFNWLIFC